jgi:predicted ATP-binding protein involved in virulence
MPSILSYFSIEGLHNRYTIKIPIRDNCLILVGDNGLYKSTVANFIFSFLTKQWDRILHYEFKSVSAVIDSKTFKFSKEELAKLQSEKDKITTLRSPNGTIIEFAMKKVASSENSDDRFPQQMLRQFEEMLKKHINEASSELPIDSQRLESSFTDTVLYLPTYRRSEQDLTSIVPELADSSDFKQAMKNWKRRSQSSGYIELVQFGMEDIEEVIERKIKAIRENWVDNIKNLLMGTFLQDIVQGTYRSINPSKINKLDDAALDTILNRIDQKILPKPQKKELQNIVDNIRSAPDYQIQEDTKVIVHFLTKLIDLHDNQEEKEKDVRAFVEVCNKYFEEAKLDYPSISLRKEVFYNDRSFNLFIRLLNGFPLTNDDEESRDVKMNMLSFGEKQIVSLFAHIYLSGSSSYFVIIDEPELSLSIPWQKHLLPDILASEHCNGLIAVTHSPFIIDNALDPYMCGLADCMEPFNA